MYKNNNINYINTLKFQNLVDSCLNIKKELRSKETNEKILSYLDLQPYFKSIDSKYKEMSYLVKYTLIKSSTFRKYKECEVILNKNDLIQNVFILLIGSVGIYKYLNNKLIFFKNIQDGEVDPVDYQNIKVRKNLAKAKSEICYIAEIEIQDYILIFYNTLLLEKMSFVSFLKELHYFKDKSTSYINIFQKYLTKHTFKKCDVLFSKGQNFKSLYLIRKGEIQITFKTVKTYNNIYDLDFFNTNKTKPNGGIHKNNFRISSTGKNNLNVKNCKLDFDYNKKFRFTTNRIFELKKFYNEEEEYKLIKLSEGEIIGQIEYALNSNSYLFNYICILDKTEVYEINLNLKHLNKFNFFFKKLVDGAQTKMDIINKRIKDIKNTNDKFVREKNKYRLAIIDRVNQKLNFIEHSQDLVRNNPKIIIKIKKRNKSLSNVRKINTNYKMTISKDTNTINNIKHEVNSNSKNVLCSKYETNNATYSTDNIRKSIFSAGVKRYIKQHNTNTLGISNRNTVSSISGLNSVDSRNYISQEKNRNSVLFKSIKSFDTQSTIRLDNKRPISLKKNDKNIFYTIERSKVEDENKLEVKLRRSRNNSVFDKSKISFSNQKYNKSTSCNKLVFDRSLKLIQRVKDSISKESNEFDSDYNIAKYFYNIRKE